MIRNLMMICVPLFVSSCSLRSISKGTADHVREFLPEKSAQYRQPLSEDRDSTSEHQFVPVKANDQEVAAVSISACEKQKASVEYPVCASSSTVVRKLNNVRVQTHDHHILLILFYFFFGLWLISWGGTLFLVGLFAANFAGTLVGLIVLSLGLMPMIGIVTMLRNRPRHRPHYSEE